MVTRIAWLLIIGVVFYVGYRGVRIAMEHFTAEATSDYETPVEEQILQDTDFFFGDAAH